MLKLVSERPGLRRASLVFKFSAYSGLQWEYERIRGRYQRALKWLEIQGLVEERFHRFHEIQITAAGRKFLKDHHD